MSNQHERLEEIDAYFNTIKGYEPLTKEEESKLASAARQGDSSALDKLITANLKFVVTVAKPYRGLGLPFSDLIAEGNLGLIKAATRFDETKGVRFISYAVWWIRSAITDAIDRYRNGLLEQEVMEYDYKAEACDDRKSSDNGVFESEAYERFTNGMSREETVSILLDELNQRERRIIEDFYGFDGNRRKELVEIAKNECITSERVRQIIDKSMTKLKSSAVSSGMYDDFRNIC